MTNNQNVQVEAYRDANVIASEINLIKSQTRTIVIQSSIEIGQRLKEAKELVAHGQWGEWLKNAVDYSQRTANNLMKIADEMGPLKLTDSNSQALANLTYTQAIALLRLDSEERENFIEKHDIQSMSTRELEDAIKEKNEALREKEEALKQIGILQERVKQAVDEKTKITLSLEATKEDLLSKQQAVDALVQKVADAEHELETVKQLPTEAQTGDYEALIAEKDRMAQELEKANAALQEANMKLEEALQEAEVAIKNEPAEIIKEVRVEVVPDHVAKRLEDLEREAKLSEHKAKFKASFEVMAGLFDEMLSTVVKIGEIDAAEKAKYLGAATNLVKKLGDKVGAL